MTRNFVGARGLEAIETAGSSSTTVAYPLYDTHGNMIATVSKNSAGTSWNIGDERNYDVWGGVRQGATTGGPKGRYVANLGHVQDDESGLIYMKARYYEPESGRFITEDPAQDGVNWFIYCSNDSVNNVDKIGKESSPIEDIIKEILSFVQEHPVESVVTGYVMFLIRKVNLLATKDTAEVIGASLITLVRGLITSAIGDIRQLAGLIAITSSVTGGGSFGQAIAGMGRVFALGVSIVAGIFVGAMLCFVGFMIETLGEFGTFVLRG